MDFPNSYIRWWQRWLWGLHHRLQEQRRRWLWRWWLWLWYFHWRGGFLRRRRTTHSSTADAYIHFLPPFPAEAVPRHQPAQQEVSAALVLRFSVWSERGLSYERHPCPQQDRAAGLVHCFLPLHSVHRSDPFHCRSSCHHQVHFHSLKSKTMPLQAFPKKKVKSGPIRIFSILKRFWFSSCSLMDG